MIFKLVLVLLTLLFSASCNRQGSFSFLEFFHLRDSEEHLSLKGIHLDGAGLLNHDVRVNGRVELIGKFETYVVIEEERVRMLIDLSRIGSATVLKRLKQGATVEVAGKVQAGENGHVYLVATAIKAG